MQWWLDEFDAGSEVDLYVKLFPELDSRLAKFAIGIFLWNMKGLIDINNPDDVSRVRQILNILDRTPGYDFFDNEFNEADPDTVCGLIGMSPLSKAEEDGPVFDYSVREIKNFEEARSYSDAVSWSMVISEDSFKEHKAKGNRFYLCDNEGWWDIPCVPGQNFPYDKFGYSLIAVEVTPDNKIAAVTSRWNTLAGKADTFLSAEDLRKVLGDINYNKLFLAHEEEMPDYSFFIDKLTPSNTGIDASIWISSENSDRIPQVKAEAGGITFSLSVNDQNILSEDPDELYFKIPTYVLKELQMWIRLNQQILLDYWHQIIDTCCFLCVMIGLPEHSVDVSRANLREERIFPEDKFRVEVRSIDSCRPHFHIVSREEGYDIRVDTRECFLINVDRYGKRNVTDSSTDESDTFSDVLESAKEWLCQRPAHPNASGNTNRENLLLLWEMNH